MTVYLCDAIYAQGKYDVCALRIFFMSLLALPLILTQRR